MPLELNTSAAYGIVLAVLILGLITIFILDHYNQNPSTEDRIAVDRFPLYSPELEAARLTEQAQTWIDHNGSNPTFTAIVWATRSLIKQGLFNGVFYIHESQKLGDLNIKEAGIKAIFGKPIIFYTQHTLLTNAYPILLVHEMPDGEVFGVGIDHANIYDTFTLKHTRRPKPNTCPYTLLQSDSDKSSMTIRKHSNEHQHD